MVNSAAFFRLIDCPVPIMNTNNRTASVTGMVNIVAIENRFIFFIGVFFQGSDAIALRNLYLDLYQDVFFSASNNS